MPSQVSHHNEWLSLIEVSGPFLSMPVLLEVFPQGLMEHASGHFSLLRDAYDEWIESQHDRAADPAIHNRWIRFVFGETLGLPDDTIVEGQSIPQTLSTTIAEHGETIRPDMVVRNPDGRPDAGKSRLLIHKYPRKQSLDGPIPGKHWKASPATRMMELLHGTGVRLGLVTNGEQWMLVDAPRGETTGFASWLAHIWLDERITLRAFRSLLGRARLFGVQDSETLEAMLAASAANQQEVTDQLGYQVRRAVEVFVQTLDRLDQDMGRELLAGVTEAALYEAALTVMMRLVFLFCAEERELLLLGDPVWDENYSVSTLGQQLREAADQHGEEVLERRHDAWCRLLATFRAVHGGIRHDRMRLLAYSGSLFNPDRFAFLEGREQGSSWRKAGTDPDARPIPVDNRTVLHLLESLQWLQVKVPGGGPAEPRRVSFRALDIEQIGHVYEGLLDHTAKRAAEPILGLQGTKDKEPEVSVSQLEALRAQGEEALVDFVHEQTGRSKSAVRNSLRPSLESQGSDTLLAACGANTTLRDRVGPFAGLVRADSFGDPVVVPRGSVYVTAGTDRRSSGTHYTPRSLTEPIVQYTLEPLVYVGPAEGKPRNEWQLRPAAELLDLRICDMACGSGAFLVQACRYLSERLAEAWDDAEKQHPGLLGVTPMGQAADGSFAEHVIPKDLKERMTFARRLVSQRCLYGVDINPLAVEMAKLSLWLLTLAKDKPFTFLDHAIRPGDSLVGIRDLEQLKHFNLDGQGKQNRLILDFLRDHVQRAVELRRKIEESPADLPEQVAAQQDLMDQAEEEMARLKYAADMLIAADFQGSNERERQAALTENSIQVAQHFSESDLGFLRRQAAKALEGRPTFQWPLEFPEVMAERGGFDAFVCNPPFLGGTRISTMLGVPYLGHLRCEWGAGNRADLCSYFLLRAADMLRPDGRFGMLATNTIREGDSREMGPHRLLSEGNQIVRAIPARRWPGQASLEVSVLWVHKGFWRGSWWLDAEEVQGISDFLTATTDPSGEAYPLAANVGRCYTGTRVYGEGFVLAQAEAASLVGQDPVCEDVIRPYLVGDDLNVQPDQSATRFVIDFGQRLQGEAERYPLAYEILDRLVRPYRETVGERGMRERWWQHQRPRPELYRAISDHPSVLARARVSEHHMLALVKTGPVFSDQVVLFTSCGHEAFAVLQSGLHEVWARRFASSLETRMRYLTADCFETFPLPASGVKPVAVIGEAYHEHRRQVMLDRWEGLTKTYNRFHAPLEAAEDIGRLRELHVEMDHAVAAAYGWTDLELGHGFHETKQGLRYTISDPARRDVLSRLLQLNHDRYAEEVAQGLHEKKGKGKKARTPRPLPQGTLLDGSDTADD